MNGIEAEPSLNARECNASLQHPPDCGAAARQAWPPPYRVLTPNSALAALAARTTTIHMANEGGAMRGPRRLPDAMPSLEGPKRAPRMADLERIPTEHAPTATEVDHPPTRGEPPLRRGQLHDVQQLDLSSGGAALLQHCDLKTDALPSTSAHPTRLPGLRQRFTIAPWSIFAPSPRGRDEAVVLETLQDERLAFSHKASCTRPYSLIAPWKRNHHTSQTLTRLSPLRPLSTNLASKAIKFRTDFGRGQLRSGQAERGPHSDE